MTALQHWAALALAGAVGTIARAGLTTAAVRLTGTAWPWGTFAVNVLGALVFGVVVGLTRSRTTLPAGLDTVLLVGLLGGFTTFSSYAFQAVELAVAGRHVAAATYVVASNLVGLLAVWVGLRASG